MAWWWPQWRAKKHFGGITGYQQGKKLNADPGQGIYFSENGMQLLETIPAFLRQDATPRASALGDELKNWEEDFADDLEMGVLEGPVLQPIPIPGVEQNGMPESPIYEQEPDAAQEDFTPPPEPEPIIEPVEEPEDRSEEVEEPEEPEEIVEDNDEPDEPDGVDDDVDDEGDDDPDTPPIIIL